jgi:hypothetical protein
MPFSLSLYLSLIMLQLPLQKTRYTPCASLSFIGTLNKTPVYLFLCFQQGRAPHEYGKDKEKPSAFGFIIIIDAPWFPLC